MGGVGAFGFLLQASVVTEKFFVYPVEYSGILYPGVFKLIQLRTDRTGIWGVVSTEVQMYRRCCPVSAWI